jgi:flagellar assembly protein FliH
MTVVIIGEIVQQSGSATKNGTVGEIEIFDYPDGGNAHSVPDWKGWGEPAEFAAGENEGGTKGAVESGLRVEFDRRLGEETRRSFEAGREKGRLEGRQLEREALTAAQVSGDQRRAQQGVELIQRFAQERDRYLHQVEHEVVELALAVSARILRREAQMDPLLLTGAVRVALGQLSGSTQVRVRVPAEDLDLWTEALALLPNLPVKPQVSAGEGMHLGDCAIETELGSVDLGIRGQLGEIERGFFDRAGGQKSGVAKAPDGQIGGAMDATEPAGREVRS